MYRNQCRSTADHLSRKSLRYCKNVERHHRVFQQWICNRENEQKWLRYNRLIWRRPQKALPVFECTNRKRSGTETEISRIRRRGRQWEVESEADALEWLFYNKTMHFRYWRDWENELFSCNGFRVSPYVWLDLYCVLLTESNSNIWKHTLIKFYVIMGTNGDLEL